MRLSLYSKANKHKQTNGPGIDLIIQVIILLNLQLPLNNQLSSIFLHNRKIFASLMIF